MIVLEEKTNIIRGGNVGVESSLKIKASAKAFKILSDGLYSDKIFAVIREISCNAYDAHVDAGKGTIPFEVVLPHQFNSNFIVRDYGKGISPENMDAVFTVFFESTKCETNDAIGCLGLGCKSPLSYTDTFVVDSYHEGVKSTYSIYKNELGIPSILPLSSQKSDEPSGVSITIPVRVEDFGNFKQKAIKVYTDFNLKPKISGQEIEIPEKDYYIYNEFFGLRPRDNKGSNAIMGNIAYPLGDLYDESITPLERKLLSLDADIFFNIGDLDISASREKLSYDKSTVANVKSKLKHVADTIQKSIIEKIETSANLWDARLVCRYLISEQNLSRICDNLKITYKGTELGIYGVSLHEQQYLDNKFPNFIIERYTMPKAKLKKETVTCIQIEDSNLFIFNDNQNDKLSNRLRNYLKGGQKAYVFTFTNKKYIRIVKDTVGFPNFTNMSEIPVVKAVRWDWCSNGNRTNRTTQPYNRSYTRKEFLFTPVKYDGKNSSYWNPTKIDEKDDIVYVRIDRFKVDGHNPTDVIEPYLKTLKDMGVDTNNFKVYGIKISEEVQPHWVELKDFVEKSVEKFVIDNAEQFATYCLKRDRDYNQRVVDTYDLKTIIPNLIGKVGPNSDFELLDQHFSNNANYAAIYNYAKLDLDLIKKQVEHINGAVDRVLKQYPLLQAIEIPNYDREEILTHTANYIELMNIKSNTTKI